MHVRVRDFAYNHAGLGVCAPLGPCRIECKGLLRPTGSGVNPRLGPCWFGLETIPQLK